MSEKVLGIIRVIRAEKRKLFDESLCFTQDRVVVARIKVESTALSASVSICSTVGVVIGLLAILAMRMGVIESVIIGAVCGGGGACFGLVIGAIIDKAKRKEKKERTPKDYLELPVEDILKADKNNFDIPYSEMIKVELDKFFRAIKLDIITREEEYKWYARGLIPEKKGVRIEDYKNLLRPIFGDRLSVKK